MHVEHHHGNTQQLADLAQRIGEDGGGSTEGIPGFRIEGEDIAVDMQDFLDLPHDLKVIGEFSLADSAGVSQQPFAADEAVNRDHIVRPVGEEGGGRHLEVDERHMGAEQKKRRSDAFHPSLPDLQAP